MFLLCMPFSAKLFIYYILMVIMLYNVKCLHSKSYKLYLLMV
jgi:hypothetical protein